MSSILQFDEVMSQRLWKLYTTPDVVGQREQVLNLLNVRKDEVVLDIGCGPGLLAFDMAQQVGAEGRVEAIDISEPVLVMAKEHCSEFNWVNIQNSDATQLPFPNNHFDAIVSTQVYEYIPDIDLALSELYRVLRPGGRALILDTEWDSSVWHTSNRERMHHIIDLWNTHCPHPRLPRTLQKHLLGADFEITQRTILSLFNPDYDPNTYSYVAIEFIVDYVGGLEDISQSEVDGWAEELHDLGAKGEYFFSLNRYVFIVTKL
jgi:arsenite methyltransferase